MAHEIDVDQLEESAIVNEEILESEDQLRQVLADLGGLDQSLILKIYKIHKGTYGHFKDINEAEVRNIETWLREEGGPGEYELRIHFTGRKGIRKRVKINISPTLSDQHAHLSHAKGIEADQVLSMVQHMLDNQAKQTQLMIENVVQTVKQNAPQPQQPVDMGAMMGTMMGIMLKMKEFVTPANETKQPDMLENMTKMLDFQTQLSNLTGGADGSAVPALVGLAKDVIPSLVDLAQVEKTNKKKFERVPRVPTPPPRMEARAQLNTPTSVHPEKAETPVIEENPEMKAEMMQRLFIKKSIDMLLPKAHAERDPATYAEVLLDTAEEYNQFDFAVGFLTQDNAVAILISIDPRIESYQLWFQGLIEAVKDMTAPEEEQPEAQHAINPMTSGTVEPDVNVDNTEQVTASSGRGSGNTDDIESDVPLGETVQN